MANAKERMMKPLISLCTKLGNMKALRKNKVGPISSNTKVNEVLLLRDGSMSIDRRDDEYLQARRAVLRSYHLINGGQGLKKKIKSSLKGLCHDVSTQLQTRVGVRVYRFTVSCPWSTSHAKIIVFRCFLPHLKSP